jgi:hypothetical protein
VARRLTLSVAVVAICVVAGLALLLTGKGGDANFVSGSALAEAASTTAKLPGANVSMHIEITIDGLSEPIEADMTGVSSRLDKSARMSGAYTHFPKAVPGQRDDGSVPIESIAILPRIYMKSPVFASSLPDGKEWLSYDIAKSSQRLGIGDPTQYNQGDPMQTLDNLRATSDRVEQVGTEDVRGVSTTHYRARVELRRLPNVVPPAQRESARRSAERLIQLAGTDSYPVEVWVDRRHMVRRISLSMNMKIPQADRRMKIDMTIEMFDFGRKPVPKPPPADKVQDVTNLAGGTP